MKKLGVLAAMLPTFLSASAYDFKVDGIYYNITDPTAKEVAVTYEEPYASTYSGNIIVPTSVTYISEQYTVTTIGGSAFANCSSLTAITIPNSVTTIGYEAFSDCTGLTSIIIPNSVTTIGSYAFYGCSGLTSITIPNSVTTIGSSAFHGCSSLTSITIPNSVAYIGDDAFSWCSSLTSITIPNSVTTIDSYAFYECNSLTSITIPNSVTTIGYEAFYNCSSLTSITIPNSVTTIEYEAFYNCSSLTSITSLAVTPPYCDGAVFNTLDKEKCTLYVPAKSVEAYKQAPEWKDFVHIEDVEAGIDSVVAGSADGATEVFNPAGLKVADTLENLPAGIYLVREGSTVRKIVVK